MLVLVRVGMIQGVGTGKGGYRLLGVLVEVYILGTRNLDPLYPLYLPVSLPYPPLPLLLSGVAIYREGVFPRRG